MVFTLCDLPISQEEGLCGFSYYSSHSYPFLVQPTDQTSCNGAEHTGKEPVVSFHTLGGDMSKIFKPLDVSLGVIGGKHQVKVVTLFLTPPFRQTPNEAKGVRPYDLLRLAT